MKEKQRHPKNDNLEILSSLMVEPKAIDIDLKDCYYTDNIYIASYLKVKDCKLMMIYRCQDISNQRMVTHFWFIHPDGNEPIKQATLNYYNDVLSYNINANSFVASLQSIKKLLNIGKANIA